MKYLFLLLFIVILASCDMKNTKSAEQYQGIIDSCQADIQAYQDTINNNIINSTKDNLKLGATMGDYKILNGKVAPRLDRFNRLDSIAKATNTEGDTPTLEQREKVLEISKQMTDFAQSAILE